MTHSPLPQEETNNVEYTYIYIYIQEKERIYIYTHTQKSDWCYVNTTKKELWKFPRGRTELNSKVWIMEKTQHLIYTRGCSGNFHISDVTPFYLMQSTPV